MERPFFSHLAPLRRAGLGLAVLALVACGDDASDGEGPVGGGGSVSGGGAAGKAGGGGKAGGAGSGGSSAGTAGTSAGTGGASGAGASGAGGSGAAGAGTAGDAGTGGVAGAAAGTAGAAGESAGAAGSAGTAGTGGGGAAGSAGASSGGNAGSNGGGNAGANGGGSAGANGGGSAGASGGGFGGADAGGTGGGGGAAGSGGTGSDGVTRYHVSCLLKAAGPDPAKALRFVGVRNTSAPATVSVTLTPLVIGATTLSQTTGQPVLGVGNVTSPTSAVLNFGNDFVIPANANPVNGVDAEIDNVTMPVALVSPTFACGELQGIVTKPGPLSLAPAGDRCLFDVVEGGPDASITAVSDAARFSASCP